MACRKRWGAATLAIGTWAALAAFGAPGDEAQENAFCDSVDAAAKAEAVTLATPEFVGSASLDQFRGTANDPFFHYERHTENRVGLEYDLAALHKSALVHKVAAAQCRSYKLDRRVSHSLDVMAARSKILGLDVQRKILADEEEAIEARLTDAKARLTGGASGLAEVDAIAEAAHSLKSALLDVDAEITHLKAALPTGNAAKPAELRGLMASWVDAQADQWTLEQQRLQAGAWHVNLIGGMQSARYDDIERPGAYGGIELRLNLGVMARNNAFDDARSARQQWLALADDSMARRGDLALAQATATLVDVKRRLAIESQRTDELAEFLGATSKLNGDGGQSAALDTSVRVKWLLSHATTEALKAQLEELIKLLEPAEAQAKEGEKPVSFAPAAPKSAEAFAMKTDVPNFRWHQDKAAPAAAETAAIRFRVKSKTATTTKLGSGEIRAQLGLMLRFINQCNLVYVMWRLADNEIHVQEKSNPGESTHEGCENNGYVTIKAAKSESLAPLAFGSVHTLAAKITDTEIIATVDGAEVWRGPAPKLIKSGKGVGFRSDNLDVDYTLLDN